MPNPITLTNNDLEAGVFGDVTFDIQEALRHVQGIATHAAIINTLESLADELLTTGDHFGPPTKAVRDHSAWLSARAETARWEASKLFPDQGNRFLGDNRTDIR